MQSTIFDEDEKICVNNPYALNTRNIITGKGNPVKWFLTEDGLYEVLMQSRKPLLLLVRVVITTKLNFQLSSS